MPDLKEAFRTADLLTAGLKKGATELKNKIESRLKKAAVITLAMAIPSIIMFSVGINEMDNWWIFAAAIWRGFFTIVLMVYLALEGTTLTFLMKGKGAIERYFGFIVSVTVLELCFAFALMMIVAFAEDINTQLVPPLILGLYILGILATLAFSPKHIAWTILILVGILVGAIFFPKFPSIKFPEVPKPAQVIQPLNSNPGITDWKPTRMPSPAKKLPARNYPTGNYKVAVMIIGSSDETNLFSQSLNNIGISATNTLDKYLSRDILSQIAGGDGRSVLNLNLSNYSQKLLVGRNSIGKPELNNLGFGNFSARIVYDFWLISTGDGTTQYFRIEKKAEGHDHYDTLIQQALDSAIADIRNLVS